jgi:hypothetical protein
MKKLWLAVIVLQLAGDATFVLATRGLRQQVPWMDVRLTRPVPDSLRQALSRFLHDSLGVVTSRREDTLIVGIPSRAERELEATIDSLRQSSLRAALPLVVGLLLLHAPLVIALGAIFAQLADGERRRRNRAIGEPWEDA